MKALTIIASLALLVACDSSPTVEAENASVAEVAEKVRAAGGGDVTLRPGKWLTKVTLDEITAPGMPAGMADQMKVTIAGRPGGESCLTEAEVRKPNAGFFAGKNDNCRYDHYKMGGGKIDAKMRCTAGGGTQTMVMSGDYGPEEYHMAMTTRMELGQAAAGAGMGSMAMKMRVEGKRIGDCGAGDAAKG